MTVLGRTYRQLPELSGVDALAAKAVQAGVEDAPFEPLRVPAPRCARSGATVRRFGTSLGDPGLQAFATTSTARPGRPRTAPRSPRCPSRSRRR